MLSEGAGILVLENLERAHSKRRTSLRRISGYSRQRDLQFRPARIRLGRIDGTGLANAEVTIADVDYIFAYGTGDQLLDAAEVDTIKEVFGERRLFNSDYFY